MADQDFPNCKAMKESSDDELRQKAEDVLKDFNVVHSAESNTARLLQAHST